MAFDTFRCPQNEIPEAQEWFFNGIGKKIGQPADDWEQVMRDCGLPPGYGPGVRPTASMPYFAITQQFSAGPKGRIFLPTDRPDENNYYTRCIQIIDDDPNRPGKLIWAWYHVAGHEYVPVEGADSMPGTPGTGEGITREELYAILADYFKVDDKVALEMNSGKIICVERGGPTEDNKPVELTSRSGVGPWESLRMKRGQ